MPTEEFGYVFCVIEFLPGAFVVELSGYSSDKRRTAMVRSDTGSELLHFSIDTWQKLQDVEPDVAGRIHKLLATTLADRIVRMNRRIISHEG